MGNEKEIYKTFYKTYSGDDLPSGRTINVTINLIKTDKPRKETFQPYIDKIIREINSGIVTQ
jgi:hypothetical protein